MKKKYQPTLSTILEDDEENDSKYVPGIRSTVSIDSGLNSLDSVKDVEDEKIGQLIKREKLGQKFEKLCMSNMSESSANALSIESRASEMAMSAFDIKKVGLVFFEAFKDYSSYYDFIDNTSISNFRRTCEVPGIYYKKCNFYYKLDRSTHPIVQFLSDDTVSASNLPGTNYYKIDSGKFGTTTVPNPKLSIDVASDGMLHEFMKSNRNFIVGAVYFPLQIGTDDAILIRENFLFMPSGQAISIQSIKPGEKCDMGFTYSFERLNFKLERMQRFESIGVQAYRLLAKERGICYQRFFFTSGEDFVEKFKIEQQLVSELPSELQRDLPLLHAPVAVRPYDSNFGQLLPVLAAKANKVGEVQSGLSTSTAIVEEDNRSKSQITIDPILLSGHFNSAQSAAKLANQERDGQGI